jgi:hypothetical protein
MTGFLEGFAVGFFVASLIFHKFLQWIVLCLSFYYWAWSKK